MLCIYISFNPPDYPISWRLLYLFLFSDEEMRCTGLKNLPQVKLLKWPVKDPIPTLEYSKTVFSPILLSEVLQNHTKMAHCCGHSILKSHIGETGYYLNVFP